MRSRRLRWDEVEVGYQERVMLGLFWSTSPVLIETNQRNGPFEDEVEEI